MKDKESEKASAQLYRFAEVTALLRLYREHEGREAASMEAVAARAQSHPRLWPSKPTPADHEAVRREHPELVLLANRSNPYLSGHN